MFLRLKIGVEFTKYVKMRRLLPPLRGLSLAEGLAVGALVHSRICLVGTHQDLVQGAVILILAVVSAGLDGAFDALVCMTVHNLFLLLFGTALVCHETYE
mgnify:CR=1 FL=1